MIKINTKKNAAIALFVVSAITVIFTLLVAFVDRGCFDDFHTVGLSHINIAFHRHFSYNDLFFNASEYPGYIPAIFAVFYAALGFSQIIKHRSFKKIDRCLFSLAFFYVLVGVTYFVFEKISPNIRPYMLEGEEEPSYPSSHTLFSLCLGGSTLLINKYFYNKESWSKALNIAAIVLMILIPTFRLFSGVHWLTDIVGGVLISGTLLGILNLLLVHAKTSRK